MTDLTTTASIGKQKSSAELAFEDTVSGLRDWRRWIRYAGFVFRKKYYRAKLGIAWPAISFTIAVTLMSLLYSTIFNRDLAVYMPHFGFGLVAWTFINSGFTESDQVFSGNASILKEFPLPYSFYVFALLARTFFYFSINFACMLAISAVFLKALYWSMLLVVPAVLLYCVNGFFISFMMGMLVTRYRDVPLMMASVMRMIFFVTPVIWLTDRREQLLPFVLANPLYHLIEIFRAPMKGDLPTMLNWGVSLSMTCLFGIAFFCVYRFGTLRLRHWL